MDTKTCPQLLAEVMKNRLFADNSDEWCSPGNSPWEWTNEWGSSGPPPRSSGVIFVSSKVYPRPYRRRRIPPEERWRKEKIVEKERMARGSWSLSPCFVLLLSVVSHPISVGFQCSVKENSRIQTPLPEFCWCRAVGASSSSSTERLLCLSSLSLSPLCSAAVNSLRCTLANAPQWRRAEHLTVAFPPFFHDWPLSFFFPPHLLSEDKCVREKSQDRQRRREEIGKSFI